MTSSGQRSGDSQWNDGNNATSLGINVDDITKLNEDTGVISELLERWETMTNQFGEICATIQKHPNRYNIQIDDLIDENYNLIEPFMAIVEEYSDEDTVIVSVPELEIFGDGVTVSEAIINLKNAILDLYDELIEMDSDTLGALPKSWLRILARKIYKS